MGPGSYHVYAKAEDAFHIYITCSSARNVSFEVDFTGVFFYFTVSAFVWHMPSMQCLRLIRTCRNLPFAVR